MWRENILARESTKGIQVKRWYDKCEILNNIEKTQLSFTCKRFVHPDQSYCITDL